MPLLNLMRSKFSVHKVTRGLKTLQVEVRNGVSIIKINRPNKKNAFTWSTYEDLADSLKSSANDPKIRVVLITGNGDFYSSGNDLSNFSRIMHPLKMASEARGILKRFVESFIEFPKPLIAAVNGPAIGIAVTTLGLCDRVFASTTSNYRTPFAELGQSPEGCSSFTFPRLMGDAIAHEVLWKGRKISAEEALEYKLVHEVHSPHALLDKAITYCEEIANLPADAPEAQRFILRDNLKSKLNAVNEEECAVLEKKWISPECFEALARFLDSRNMKTQAMIMRVANATGFLWGQPR